MSFSDMSCRAAGSTSPSTAFYTVWFISGPVVILLGNIYILKWVRETVVSGVDHC